jgi:hypothetical protein
MYAHTEGATGDAPSEEFKLDFLGENVECGVSDGSETHVHTMTMRKSRKQRNHCFRCCELNEYASTYCLMEAVCL